MSGDTKSYFANKSSFIGKNGDLSHLVDNFSDGWEERLGAHLGSQLRAYSSGPAPVLLDWLPLGWEMAWKHQPGKVSEKNPDGLRRMYVSPIGQVYANKADVEKAVLMYGDLLTHGNGTSQAQKESLPKSSASKSDSSPQIPTSSSPQKEASKKRPAETAFSQDQPERNVKQREAAQGEEVAVHPHKIWTYGEVVNKGDVKKSEKPAHWPVEVEVSEGKVGWLPEDWGQGMKLTSGGKYQKTYVSPEGKLYYHKEAVEKVLGRSLEVKVKEKSADGPPGSWPYWLPCDWALSKKTTSGGNLLTIYVHPSMHRYFFHKEDVEKKLAGADNGAKLVVGPLESDNKKQDSATDEQQSTDSEVEDISSVGAYTGDGYEISICRAGAAWVVMPEDVKCIDLQLLRAAMESVGWSCMSQSPRCDTFSFGSCSKYSGRLYAKSGRLLVSSTVKLIAIEAASAYIDQLSKMQ